SAVQENRASPSIRFTRKVNAATWNHYPHTPGNSSIAWSHQTSTASKVCLRQFPLNRKPRVEARGRPWAPSLQSTIICVCCFHRLVYHIVISAENPSPNRLRTRLFVI